MVTQAKHWCWVIAFGAGVMFSHISADAAAVDIPGLSFSVADAFGGPFGVGTHFHADPGGVPLSPFSLSEVGEFFGSEPIGTTPTGEQVRGMTEFDIAGRPLASSAIMSFKVFDEEGIFGQPGIPPFDVAIQAYVGDNVAQLDDFQIADIGNIGIFNTGPLVEDDMLMFDVTGIYNALVGINAAAFGARLQTVIVDITAPSPAYTFDRFVLSVEPANNGIIPEPATAACLLALTGAGVLRRSRRRAAGAS